MVDVPISNERTVHIGILMEFPIVEKLGGREKALEVLLRRCGKTRGEDAIRRWRYRSMPGYAQTAFMAECEQRGIPFSSDDFKVKALDDAA